MKTQEKDLFFELCNITQPKDDKMRKKLQHHATAEVLGHLCFNRMAGTAYSILKKNRLLDAVNREFRTSLQNIYEYNVIKNESFFKCVNMITELLKPCEDKYAMLKGALLCKVYPEGCRTSNDIDLLVCSDNVTEIGQLLQNAGFKQGYVQNREFVPATRREIIESKMTRGETVPFIKQVNRPFMKYLEVDINFSLDYKNGDSDAVRAIISRAKQHTVDDLSVITLAPEDFFIHLCGHLYKEATTLPWITMRRDMTLYKYSDINLMLTRFSKNDIKTVFKRAKELGLAEICACVILWSEELLPSFNESALQEAKNTLEPCKELLTTVISPTEEKQYRFTEESVVKRFFDNERGKKIRSC